MNKKVPLLPFAPGALLRLEGEVGGMGNTSLVVIPILCCLASVPRQEPSLLEVVVRFIDFYFFLLTMDLGPGLPLAPG